MSQPISIPAGCTATLSFWLHIDTAETTTSSRFDTLTVTAGGTTLATFSNLDHNTGYTKHTLSLSSLAGRNTTLTFTGTEDTTKQTSFVIDDTTLTLT